MTAARPRVLLAITVYNGEAFVARTLRLGAADRPDDAAVDVLVLDDASPEPGWSERLAAMCEELRDRLLPHAPQPGHPAQRLARPADRASSGLRPRHHQQQRRRSTPATWSASCCGPADHDGVGSVTAWSNNVSMYSLPNADPDRFLADQDRVDWISASLAGHYRRRRDGHPGRDLVLHPHPHRGDPRRSG